MLLAAIGESTSKKKTIAVNDKIRPIACANRFGGPGTSRGVMPMRGTSTRVARSPVGLRVGPVNTRAAKP